MLKKIIENNIASSGPRHDTTDHHYSVLFSSLCWCLVFGSFKIPVQTQFDKVKGDMLTSVCIAGEKSRVLGERGCYFVSCFANIPACLLLLNTHSVTTC